MSLANNNQWIDVTERLPDEGKIVLAYTPIDGYMFVGFYRNEEHYRNWNIITSMRSSKKITKRVSHWMELPDTPYDKNKAAWVEAKEKPIAVRPENQCVKLHGQLINMECKHFHTPNGDTGIWPFCTYYLKTLNESQCANCTMNTHD